MSKNKEPGIPAYYLLIVIVFMVGFTSVVMHYYNLIHLDNDTWKKETEFSVQAQIKDVFFDTNSKGRSTWSYANLDNNMLLINPINSSMLCNTPTMPRDFDLVGR